MRTGRLLLAGLALLVVAGCSEPDVVADPAPLATPTAGSVTPTTPSASPTSTRSSPTTTVPTGSSSIPAAARAHTNAGAEAFVRFYFGALNESWSLANSAPIRPLALAACRTCANFVATAEALSTKRQHYAGPAVEVGPMISLPESTPSQVVVQMALTQKSTEILDENGAVVRSSPKARNLAEADVSWTAMGIWRIAELRIATGVEGQ